MKTHFKSGLILVCLIASISFNAPTSYAGNDNPYAGKYDVLKQTRPAVSGSNKIEVVEFFWYGCGHCYQLERPLKKWLKTKPDDVEFIQIPALFYETHPWAPLAKLYYTAKRLKVLDKVHTPIFYAIHGPKKHQTLWQTLLQIFAKHGVSQEQLIDTFYSFDILDDINEAEKVSKTYGVRSVPIVFVNGKYRLSGGKAGGYKKLIKILDYLIEKERHTQSLKK
jgi:thiol:disulfide interchange protein DsbA